MKIAHVKAGSIFGFGISILALSLVAFGYSVGWDATWRAFGVTPLQPHFFDMHVINDYAACAAQGIDPYAPKACNVDNYNIPRTWLWLGHFGVDGTDSAWLSSIMIGLAAVVLTLLFRRHPWPSGLVGLTAITSPTVLMGAERGNLDVLILALVASAALLYDETRPWRAISAWIALTVGVVLKLLPLFCISLAASRLSTRKVLFVLTFASISAVYLALTLDDVLLIRRNVPTTFILSYGYKSAFIGIDHIRSEAGLMPLHLAETWAPIVITLAPLVAAGLCAAACLKTELQPFKISESSAGRAFMFGASTYVGTYVLGTNFVYRLMFLVLCVPQLVEWQLGRRRAAPELGLLGLVLAVLWLNGNANGHSSFLLLPQVFNWVLFLWLFGILFLSLLRTLFSARSDVVAGVQGKTGTQKPNNAISE